MEDDSPADLPPPPEEDLPVPTDGSNPEDGITPSMSHPEDLPIPTDLGPDETNDGQTDEDANKDTNQPPIDTQTLEIDTTQLPECADFTDTFQITSGDCTLTVCPKFIDEFKGERVEMKGTPGTICEAKVYVDGFTDPVTLTVQNDQNGDLKLTCDLFPQPMKPFCNPNENTITALSEDGNDGSNDLR